MLTIAISMFVQAFVKNHKTQHFSLVTAVIAPKTGLTYCQQDFSSN